MVVIREASLFGYSVFNWLTTRRCVVPPAKLEDNPRAALPFCVANSHMSARKGSKLGLWIAVGAEIGTAVGGALKIVSEIERGPALII